MDFDDKRASKSTALSAREMPKRNRDSSKIAKEEQVNPVSKIYQTSKKSFSVTINLRNKLLKVHSFVRFYMVEPKNCFSWSILM